MSDSHDVAEFEVAASYSSEEEARQAAVAMRMDDLADGTDRIRSLEAAVMRHDRTEIHMNVLKDHGAAAGDALPETVPVVDDPDAVQGGLHRPARTRALTPS